MNTTTVTLAQCAALGQTRAKIASAQPVYQQRDLQHNESELNEQGRVRAHSRQHCGNGVCVASVRADSGVLRQ